ncbi:c-type cytochrome [Pararoseomonas indoligenes]|uniref:C-type cytochrome n=1 Tax=Roseomonas indoligenes TaxID=2820811 RepID=A0A940MWD3_9PROT|nr:c-type cytochrome [Pararoseomonas indoligenes]MBP0495438.1 c-type cytochrome [Pararoseomonas indoligenes]
MRILLVAALAVAAMPAFAQDAPDPAKGRTLFQRQCSACHQVTAARNGGGPYLQGVVGRPAASAEGFNYSPALKASGITWSVEELNAFLADPQGKVRGTRQPIRVTNDSDRRDIVAYLAAPGG